jgi:hypothetical protein
MTVAARGEADFAATPDDLAASFGPGVQLKRVILQLTNDPITPPPEKLATMA